MSNQLGDGPIDEVHAAQMNAIMSALDEAFNGKAKGKNKKVGIVLWVFPYGLEEGRANYISNGADRRDMITLMKEQIARFEGQPEIKGEA